MFKDTLELYIPLLRKMSVFQARTGKYLSNVEEQEKKKRKRVKTSPCSMSSVTWQKALDLCTTARPSSRVNRKIWQIF